MEQFEWIGTWRLPGGAEKWPGVLRYRPDFGLELELSVEAGGKAWNQTALQGPEFISLIVGTANSKDVSLVSCQFFGYHYDGRNIKRRYHVQTGYIGIEFENVEEIMFSSMSFRYVEGSEFHQAMTFSSQAERYPSPVLLSLHHNSRIFAHHQDFSLEIAGSWSNTSNESNSRSLSWFTSFRAISDRQRPPDEFIDGIDMPMRALISIALRSGVRLQSISAEYMLTTGADIIPIQVEVLRDFIGGNEPSNTSRRHILFSTSDLVDVSQFVKLWLAMYETHKEALQNYAAVRLQKRTFIEQAFLAAISLFEGVHDAMGGSQLSDQEIAFNQRRRQSILASCPVEHLEWLEKQLEYSNMPLRKRLDQTSRNDPFKSIWSSKQRYRSCQFHSRESEPACSWASGGRRTGDDWAASIFVVRNAALFL